MKINEERKRRARKPKKRRLGRKIEKIAENTWQNEKN